MSAALVNVDRSAWGSCAGCGQDLPDGGDRCDACAMPRRCGDCGAEMSPGEPRGNCATCAAYDRSQAKDQLAQRLLPGELVAVYKRADADIRTGFALIVGATDALNSAFTLDGSRGVSVQDSRENINFSEPGKCLEEIRRGLWHTMVERLEIRRLMSVKAWKELNEQIDKGEVPDLTEEAIAAMVKQFSDAAPAMLEQAVIEVFDFLRPPHSEYKRNSEFEVPRRVALTWVIDTWYTRAFPSKFLQPRHQAEQQLTALENVFSSIDGRGSVSKGHVSNLSETIRKTKRGEAGRTEYFEFRGFSNGALHLTFLREDLLRKFNQIAGGARLKPQGAQS